MSTTITVEIQDNPNEDKTEFRFDVNERQILVKMDGILTVEQRHIVIKAFVQSLVVSSDDVGQEIPISP